MSSETNGSEKMPATIPEEPQSVQPRPDNVEETPAPMPDHIIQNEGQETNNTNNRPPDRNRDGYYNNNYRGNSNNGGFRDNNSSGGWYRGNGNRSRFGQGRGSRGNSMGYNNNGFRRRGRGRRFFKNTSQVYRELSDTNVYITNIPPQWSEDVMRKEFSEFGMIKSAAIIPTHQSRIAFIDFQEKESASKCVEELKTRIYENLPEGQNIVAKPAFIKRPYNYRQNSSRSYDFNNNNNNNNQPQNPVNNRPMNKNMNSPGGNGRNMSHHYNNNNNRNNNKSHMRDGSLYNNNHHGSENDLSDSSNNLVQHMGSDWGPSSRKNHGPNNRGAQMQNNGPSQQQQIMIMVDPQTGMQMQVPMQLMEVNGQMCQVVQQPMMQQPVMQQPMQIMQVQTQNGEWVQQMVPVNQFQQNVQNGQQMEHQQMFEIVNQPNQEANNYMIQQHHIPQSRSNPPPPGFNSSGTGPGMDQRQIPHEQHMQMPQNPVNMQNNMHVMNHQFDPMHQFNPIQCNVDQQQQYEQPMHDPNCYNQFQPNMQSQEPPQYSQ